MPAPKSKTGKTDLYKTMQVEGFSTGDNNFCTVVAIAAATGVPFSEVQTLMAAAGRVKGRGVNFMVQETVLAQLGFIFERTTIQEIVSGYPAKAREHFSRTGVTTHHPERFNKVWPKGTYFLYSTGHVSCVIDGVLHDWSTGRSLRCNRVYRVVRA